MWEPDSADGFAPYYALRQKWYDGHLARLAETIGGGEVGPGPALAVSNAAIQFAASRWLSDLAARTKDIEAMASASRLADSSSRNVMIAHELCAKEAAGRAKAQQAGQPWLGETAPADPAVGLTGKRGRPKKRR
ncbi:unnamed protein product [marine sediment metagenome]|uniref:Uncharacterized protein n=1 Tax=marine sediment metagenome TaxID=412755 RepID=X0USB4_9ZZZZ